MTRKLGMLEVGTGVAVAAGEPIPITLQLLKMSSHPLANNNRANFLCLNGIMLGEL
jgi:hypothetical protein